MLVKSVVPEISVRTPGSSEARSRWFYLIALWIGGCAIVGLIAVVCRHLQLQLATAGFCMLIAIVLLSLLDSFISSVVFSVTGALLLNVCFTPPLFSFAIEKTVDLLPLLAFLVTSITVTSLVREIRRAEQIVRKSQAQFLEEVQGLSKTGSLGWTAGTGVVFWSAEAHRIFEQDISVVPTIAIMRELVHPDDLAIFDAMVTQIEAGGDGLDVEYRLRFPDGRIKYVRVVGHAVGTRERQRQFVGAMMDVTEARQTGIRLRQLENDLAKTSRISALAGLSASIAHEMGQPLTAVVVNGDACLGWLHRTPLNIEEVERLVARMREDATRAADIVRRVRRLVRGTPPDMMQIDIGGLLQEVVAFLRPELDTHGCRVSTHIARDLPAVAGDRVQLQQVLVNLITNALQAMATISKKRELVLGAQPGGVESVIVSVHDNGSGIDEDHLPHLFDAFFTTRDSMGMGLAIAASIVEAHGGRLWVINNADGGSTFSFTLKTV